MSRLHHISGPKGAERKADVVFLHGLGGDAFTTWRSGVDEANSWPHWLGEDFPEVAVWSLGYAASPTRWAGLLRLIGRGSRDSGHGMALPDHARQVLSLLVDRGFGERPLMFVCHSLGGLLAKQILPKANDAAPGTPNRRIAVRTRAILFLATPHAGAELASLASSFRILFGATVSLADLRHHDTHLRDLSEWYRNFAPQRAIQTRTYYESRSVRGVLPIVDPTSANPMVGDDPVALDEDHLSIAKPRERDADVCRAANVLLRSHVLSTPAAASPVPPGGRRAPPEGPPRIPREMPPAAHRFFGRTAERERLVERLRAGLSTAVVGPAGLGKTALAAAALAEVVGANAERLADSPFPDGLVYLDLYQLRGETEPTLNTLANRISGAGFLERWPARERATEACRARRLLVVVEGGEEADGSTGRATIPELFGVLSPENCRLLLTRTGGQAEVAETVDLRGALDPADAADLLDFLTARRPLDPPVRDAVLEVLEGHPLAINWAGNLLALDEEDPAALAAEWRGRGLPGLSDPTQAQRTLHWLFDRSVRGLDDPARQALAAAGLLARAPFPLGPIAAAIGELAEDGQARDEGARGALKVLARRGLLGRAEGDQWQFTHVLGYRFARNEETSDPEMRQALGRWLDGQLVVELRAGSNAASARSLATLLQHAGALLAADTDQRLWDPLGRFLLSGVADCLEEIGRLDLVGRPLTAVAEWIARLPEAKAEKPSWLHQRGLLLDHQGDLLRSQGNLPGALATYSDSLEVRRRLAEADPLETYWERELSVSHNKVGDVRRDQGDLAGALAAYNEALAVGKRLAEADPSNAGWQRDLSHSQARIGDVLRDQGDLTGALAAYHDSLAVMKCLAEADPANVGWKRNLNVSQERIGDVLRDQGDLAGALAAYREALPLRNRLTKADPSNTGWQRDLSVSQEKIGNVLLVQGDLAGALAAYGDSLAVRKRLAETDPSNAIWQRDLCVSHNKVGDVLRDQNDLASALAAYHEALAVIRTLAEADPSNAGWQRDLSFSLTRVAQLHERQGDRAAALPLAEESLAIAERLAALDRSNVIWQKDVAVSRALVAQLRDGDG